MLIHFVRGILHHSLDRLQPLLRHEVLDPPRLHVGLDRQLHTLAHRGLEPRQPPVHVGPVPNRLLLQRLRLLAQLVDDVLPGLALGAGAAGVHILADAQHRVIRGPGHEQLERRHHHRVGRGHQDAQHLPAERLVLADPLGKAAPAALQGSGHPPENGLGRDARDLQFGSGRSQHNNQVRLTAPDVLVQVVQIAAVGNLRLLLRVIITVTHDRDEQINQHNIENRPHDEKDDI
mmetsp:Transcript_53063/g.139889  ORF Transcript_53063/g.139889 Transcript_53063/m.139889 type:complete len:233 (+) Transcript_53063:205-903(+)